MPLMHHDFAINHRVNNVARFGIVDKGRITAVIRLKVRLININNDQIGFFTPFERANLMTEAQHLCRTKGIKNATPERRSSHVGRPSANAWH